MDVVWVQALATVVVGVISGWVAGHLGVRRALAQKRSEELLRRRLELMEQLSRSLDEVVRSTAKLREVLKGEYSEVDVAKHMVALVNTWYLPSNLLVEALMYFDSALIDEIVSAMETVGIRLHHLAEANLRDEYPAADRMRLLNELSDALRELRMSIVRGMRVELGLNRSSALDRLLAKPGPL